MVNKRNFGSTVVRGIDLDGQTRCTHYRSELDIIAIRHRCCYTFFACIKCHDEIVHSTGEDQHASQPWPKGSEDELAVLCGSCLTLLTIGEYKTSGSICPKCNTSFNPHCRDHWELYFE